MTVNSTNTVLILEAVFPTLSFPVVHEVARVSSSVDDAVRLCQQLWSPDLGSPDFSHSAFVVGPTAFVENSEGAAAGLRRDAASRLWGAPAVEAVSAAAECMRKVRHGNAHAHDVRAANPEDPRAKRPSRTDPAAPAASAMQEKKDLLKKPMKLRELAVESIFSSDLSIILQNYLVERVDIMFTMNQHRPPSWKSEYNETVCVFPVDTSEYDSKMISDAHVPVQELMSRVLPLPTVSNQLTSSSLAAWQENDQLSAPIIRWAPKAVAPSTSPTSYHEPIARTRTGTLKNGNGALHTDPASLGATATEPVNGKNADAPPLPNFDASLEGTTAPRGTLGGIVFCHDGAGSTRVENDDMSDTSTVRSCSILTVDKNAPEGIPKKRHGEKRGAKLPPVWELHRDSKSSYQFLIQEREKWKQVLTELQGVKDVFSEEGRCDLIKELYHHHRDLMINLCDFVPQKLLPVIASLMVGKEVVPQLYDQPIAVPGIIASSKILLLSCAPAKIIRLKMASNATGSGPHRSSLTSSETGEDSISQGLGGAFSSSSSSSKESFSALRFLSESEIELKLRIEELELEPIRFSYREGKKVKKTEGKGFSAEENAPPYSGGSGYSAASPRSVTPTSQPPLDLDDDNVSRAQSSSSSGVTQGTVSVRLRNVVVTCQAGCSMFSTGKNYCVITNAKVKIAKVSLKFSISKLNMLARVLNRFIRNAMEKQAKAALIGRHTF